MEPKEIREENDIRKINYYLLGEIMSRHTPFPVDNPELTDLVVSRRASGKGSLLFRFYDIKLVKYFVAKLSQANFKRERMKIKYGLYIIFFFLISVQVISAAEETTIECINETVLTEREKSPDYDFLSFPAISTDDPYVQAISYFNNRLSVIVTEDYVSQYEFTPVPYPVYKTFLYSDSKTEYFNKCVKGNYNSIKVY